MRKMGALGWALIQTNQTNTLKQRGRLDPETVGKGNIMGRNLPFWIWMSEVVRGRRNVWTILPYDSQREAILRTLFFLISCFQKSEGNSKCASHLVIWCSSYSQEKWWKGDTYWRNREGRGNLHLTFDLDFIYNDSWTIRDLKPFEEK